MSILTAYQKLASHTMSERLRRHNLTSIMIATSCFDYLAAIGDLWSGLIRAGSGGVRCAAGPWFPFSTVAAFRSHAGLCSICCVKPVGFSIPSTLSQRLEPKDAVRPMCGRGAAR